jgi:hypothetical protein
MWSISEWDIAGACDTCGGPTDDLGSLRGRAGDNVCEQCDALFTAAHALLDNDVHDERTILGTLAFAWSSGAGFRRLRRVGTRIECGRGSAAETSTHHNERDHIRW